MKSCRILPPRVARPIICLTLFFGGLTLRGASKADAEAEIKSLTEKYRASGMPQPAVDMMIQMERERLFPEERAAAEARRAAEGIKRARANADGDDDEAAEPSSERETYDKIPPLNSGVVNSILSAFESEATLITYLQGLAEKTEAALGAERLTVATPHLGKGRATGYAGLGFWLHHDLDLGLYLMLKACLEQPADLVLLNNFSACLSLSGLPQKAVPLLAYLNRQLPGRPTVLNNLGQAWLGLGHIAKAKPLLEQVVAIDEQHPEAQRSLAAIAAASGNPAAAAAHLAKAMSGAFDTKAYLDWCRFAPGRDVAPILRAQYAKHYREAPITKRWQLPEVPADISTAQAKETSIAQYFANLDATLHDLRSKMTGIQDAAFQTQATQFQRMQQQVAQMSSLADVKSFYARHGAMFHPLKAKAQIMLNALRSRDYATSYDQRIEQAATARSEAMKAFSATLRPMNSQIASLNKQIGKMEGGEGDEEVKIHELEQKICALRAQIQTAEISGHASINMSYIEQVETIANQRLQEVSFWTALYDLPNDPSPGLYHLYEQYLAELSQMKNYYPLPAPLRVICEGERDGHEAAKVVGKMQLWEDSHCPIELNVDVVVAHGRINCREVSIGLKFEGLSADWDRQLDPVTWDVVGHSISVSAGIGEFERKLTDNLTGKIGMDGKVTIKLDAELMPTDLIVKGQVGAELSGPGGGKAGADIGSAEISVQSGFRGAGPVPEMVGAMFGN